MSNRRNIVVYRGRLLPDDTPVDFVLWARDRDFEILESSNRRSGDEASRREGREIAGWFFAPDPA